MNERSRELIGYVDVNAKIRELAEQSGCTIDRLGYGEGNLEKLAELIVRECADFIDSKLEMTEHSHEVVAWADGDDLKEHFGVE